MATASEFIFPAAESNMITTAVRDDKIDETFLLSHTALDSFRYQIPGYLRVLLSRTSFG
jgi:hypothetical protein